MWTTVITPRFGNLDGLRHINNCNLPIWFESGREGMMSIFHPEIDWDNWHLIMAKITVEYLKQMHIGSDITIKSFIKKIGRSSVTMHQEAWQNNQLGAKGESIIVYYDFKNNKSMTIPDNIRKELEKHMLPSESSVTKNRSGRFTVIKDDE